MTLNMYDAPMVVKTLPSGYLARAATLEDVPATVEVANAASRAVFGHNQTDIPSIQAEWSQPNMDIRNQSQAIFNPAGEMVAILEYWDLDEPPIKPWVWARVHPDYEGLGLGTYLLRWAENRAQQTLPKCPPEAQFALMVGCPMGHTPSETLFKAEGYQLVRHFYTMRIDMEAKPDEPVIADGLRIRNFRPEDSRATFHALLDAFRDHWGFVEPTNFDEEWERWEHVTIKESSFVPSLYFLAEDEASGEIAGIALCRTKGWSDPDLGWVDDLGVRRAYRKKGVGLALLQTAFRAFWERGQKNVGLGVDATNLTGALRLYERAGMYQYRQRSAYEKVLRDGVDLSTQSLS